jgi:hypothetical protein
LHFASQLTSTHVVTGFPEQRLSAVAAKIKNVDAHYCAILKPQRFSLLGLLHFSDVISEPGTATRILADLMRPPSPNSVHAFTPVEHVLNLLERDPSEIVVESESGEFCGLITPDSFTRWVLTYGDTIELPLNRIPANSRWHPYPQRAGESQESVA